MKKSRISKNNIVFKLIAFILLASYSVILLGLIFWGVMASFKHKLDFSLYPGNIFPKYAGFQWSNYVVAYQVMKVQVDVNGQTGYAYIQHMIVNSTIWVFGSAFLNTFTTVLVAYCCSRFSRHVFSKILYYTVVVAMTLPIIGSSASMMNILDNIMGIYDTWFVLPATKISFVSSYFLVFYGVFASVPTSYREAAELDGAGHWTIFFKIMLPFVSSTFLAIFILSVIAYWNDYSAPMMFLPKYPTVAQGIYDLMNGQSGRDKRLTDAVSLAAAYLSALPTVILFVVFRNRIMTNVTLGGLKG